MSGGRSFSLRKHRGGDMGWILERHGVGPQRVYGFDEGMEAMAAGVIADFLRHYDPERERCWMATVDGERRGCVFLVKRSAKTAQLRLLWVDKRARGRGIGKALVQACVRFARRSGYSRVILGTDDLAVSARSIYAAAGFRLTRKKSHRAFGVDTVGETWELSL